MFVDKVQKDQRLTDSFISTDCGKTILIHKDVFTPKLLYKKICVTE